MILVMMIPMQLGSSISEPLIPAQMQILFPQVWGNAEGMFVNLSSRRDMTLHNQKAVKSKPWDQCMVYLPTFTINN